MKHEATVNISKEEYDKVNNLLKIESLSEMTDNELLAAGANTNTCVGIFSIEFDDGSRLNYDLCSGTTNYFDDVVWSNGDADIVLDCMFELDDIEFEIYGEEYLVHINII